MTWLWILDVKSLDGDCSFLYCTSVWSTPDSSRSGVWNEFKTQVKTITDEEILKYISGWVVSKDTWTHKVYESHKVSPKGLCLTEPPEEAAFYSILNYHLGWYQATQDALHQKPHPWALEHFQVHHSLFPHNTTSHFY